MHKTPSPEGVFQCGFLGSVKPSFFVKRMFHKSFFIDRYSLAVRLPAGNLFAAVGDYPAALAYADTVAPAADGQLLQADLTQLFIVDRHKGEGVQPLGPNTEKPLRDHPCKQRTLPGKMALPTLRISLHRIGHAIAQQPLAAVPQEGRHDPIPRTGKEGCFHAV